MRTDVNAMHRDMRDELHVRPNTKLPYSERLRAMSLREIDRVRDWQDLHLSDLDEDSVEYRTTAAKLSACIAEVDRRKNLGVLKW